MSLEQFETDDDFRKMLVDAFAKSEISHGEWFDDCRRWCCICQSARFMCEPVDDNVWAEKTCPECSGLWPEYVDMVVYNLINDEDFSDEIPKITIN